MKPYIIIVHKDPDSAYRMSFPDAPGCFSGADDIDDLFSNAQAALELWLYAMNEKGGEIPTPRDPLRIETRSELGGKLCRCSSRDRPAAAKAGYTTRCLNQFLDHPAAR
jgi:predicted RNase H-like HicB family nuclease